MISPPVNSEPLMASLRLKTSSKYDNSCCLQLWKKRPRSIDGNVKVDACTVIKPIRRVRFFESPSSPSLWNSKHNNHTSAEGNVGKRESTNSDPRDTFSDDNAWYSKCELAEFAKQARDYVLGIDDRWGNTDHFQCTRGFERYNIVRAQQKTMTRNIILLLMQQNSLSDEEKSLIANRSSAWAVEEAFFTGCRDYCDAYHPHLSHILNSDVKNTTIMEAKSTTDNASKEERKRSKPTSAQSCEHRNVRCRVA
mmetsp:Transcript_1748/g.4576  ORF Transcript_1748/g.4576 Transcript_1748/m.4576 type:complete len:252 (-) Transcript_1748:48-803(-)|eukprot:CAMPEP_0172370104 /NCGR_PEP_ID=MMETSP1060-20121228/36289_1 /TAXON_ID=37318 /ORGANISM="Pseudo-nitzschia pungens, Strain cf. cingulata" /LENGTH=251 /DNA_ID=CAMNT_0013095275 /DNA_START=127 /DNA_END=882 /DNA_ORIENTATION=-